MISGDVIANKNNKARNKRSSDCILEISIRSTLKTWNTM